MIRTILKVIFLGVVFSGCVTTYTYYPFGMTQSEWMALTPTEKAFYRAKEYELQQKKSDQQVVTTTPKEQNFKGVNSKYDLAQADEIMQNRIKKEVMINGVIMKMPHTIYIDYGVEFIGESIIENGVSILGSSKIENSHIKTNSIVESANIVNSSIGPLARVRPDSNISESHIGNFVEIKKSTLNGVKAGHLSYLGDASIDNGTNIGAGTITCNYDGKNKYKTQIGKNVFIGSDSQLVAPITIEDDVMVAAGTTVTKDIKKGSLAISRHPLKTISNFFYKFFK
jgi:bifunctional UDP-N-acetylglucosamine pyrophosphorylase/glucosamine-1-phosphate N-acetyltransferase